MKRTLINQIARGALAIPMFLLAFSLVSCSNEDEDEEEEDSTLTADTSANDTSDDEETTSSETSDDETTSSDTTYVNGYAAVDLGLSVKWATCNVGASSPEDYGDYFAWGETDAKDSYISSNSVTYGVEMDDISGDAEYDAATANWGSKWRMPTKEELEELLLNCSWTWKSRNGKMGFKVVGKKNGNSIFLPAAGYRNVTSLYFAGDYGTLWSSTPEGGRFICACILYFSNGDLDMNAGYRNRGYSVRPVSD